MTETMIDRVAKAIKAETDKFDMPVNFYIEPEAGARFERDNPGKDRFLDAELDDLESYRIIARAAIKAMREPTHEMKLAAFENMDSNGYATGNPASDYTAMIDTAVKE